MASRSSLLVDLGATYVKVAVLRPDEGIVGETNSSVPQFTSLDGPYRTLDPDAVLAAAEAAIASVLPLAANPERILLSGQMHGWTLTDEHNVPHLPLVTWQDNRALLARNGIRYLDQLRNSQPPEIWQAVGNELRSGLPVAGYLRYRSDGDRRSSPRGIACCPGWLRRWPPNRNWCSTSPMRLPRGCSTSRSDRGPSRSPHQSAAGAWCCHASVGRRR
jgi:hypothetical protein